MLKLFFILLFVIVSWLPVGTAIISVSTAQEVVIFQSRAIKPYNDAVIGFTESLSSLTNTINRGVKSIQPINVNKIILDGPKPLVNLTKELHKQQPDLIVAVGSIAINTILKTNEPFLFLLAPGAERKSKEHAATFTGIRMILSPKNQLRAIKEQLPDLIRLGTLFNPETTGKMAREAQLEAKALGIDLIAKGISASKNVFASITNIEDRIDGFWMLPDPTIITPDTLETIMLYSMEKRIPVITFAEKHLKYGAALAVYASYKEMGKQAAELAARVLKLAPQDWPEPEYAKAVEVRTNPKIMKKLGINHKELK